MPLLLALFRLLVQILIARTGRSGSRPTFCAEGGLASRLANSPLAAPWAAPIARSSGLTWCAACGEIGRASGGESRWWSPATSSPRQLREEPRFSATPSTRSGGAAHADFAPPRGDRSKCRHAISACATRSPSRERGAERCGRRRLAPSCSTVATRRPCSKRPSSELGADLGPVRSANGPAALVVERRDGGRRTIGAGVRGELRRRGVRAVCGRGAARNAGRLHRASSRSATGDRAELKTEAFGGSG